MSNIKICVSDTMPAAIKNRKQGNVWIRPTSGKIYSVNEYRQLYVSSNVNNSLVTTEGELAWFHEALNGLKENFNSQGIPTATMAVLFQKVKDDIMGMLSWNTPNPQVYKVPQGVNVLHFIADCLKTTALYYDPPLKNIATPLNAHRDLIAVQEFELEQPQVFTYGGIFFGKYRSRIAPIMLAIADALDADADLGNYLGSPITAEMPGDRSALIQYAAGIVDYISSTIS